MPSTEASENATIEALAARISVLTKERADYVRDRSSGGNRGSEVALHHHEKPAQKLDWQRLVKAVIGLELGDEFLRRVRRQDRRDRVARRDMHEKKDEKRDAERHRCSIENPTNDVDHRPPVVVASEPPGALSENSRLTVSPMASTRPSSKRGPTNWSPTGSPLGPWNPGTATQGT